MRGSSRFRLRRFPLRLGGFRVLYSDSFVVGFLWGFLGFFFYLGLLSVGEVGFLRGFVVCMFFVGLY